LCSKSSDPAPCDADTEDWSFQFQPFSYDAKSLHRLVARFGASPAEFKDLPLVKLLDSAMQVSHGVVSNCQKLASLLEGNYVWPQPAAGEVYDRTCEIVAQAEIESRFAATAPAEFLAAVRRDRRFLVDQEKRNSDRKQHFSEHCHPTLWS
jgi:hypothetical protein